MATTTFDLQSSAAGFVKRASTTLHTDPEGAASLFLDELYRRRAFPNIAFRQSPIGQQAYIRGTRLKVWSVVITARDLDDDLGAVADHFEVDPALVQEALAYADRFPVEIEAAIEYGNSFDFERLQSILPHAQLFEFTADPIG